MQIDINDWSIEFLLCPVFGIAVGVNYYNPELDNDDVTDDEFYNDLTFLFGVFGLKIRWWKN